VIHRSIDYLTNTVLHGVDGLLCSRTGLLDERGVARHALWMERRSGEAGEVQRKGMREHGEGPMLVFGGLCDPVDYWSWNCPAEAGQWSADVVKAWQEPDKSSGVLVTREWCRPSRLDVAFDLGPVPAEMWPREFCGAHCFERPLGKAWYVFGPEDTHSRYAGGKTSLLKVRIYRKDLELKQKDGVEGFPPTMRVELQAKGKRAAQLWWAYLEDVEKMYAWAAMHIRRMIGLTVGPCEGVPPLAYDAGTHVVHKTAKFVRSRASDLVVLCRLGEAGLLTWDGLKELATSGMSRATRFRSEAKLKELEAAGPAEVLKGVRGRLVRTKTQSRDKLSA
jgi:hypothetical protein